MHLLRVSTPRTTVTTLAQCAFAVTVFACGGEHASAPGAAPAAPSTPAGGTSAAAPASASAAVAGRTMLHVGGDQPGILLSVDDRFVGPLPQDLDVTPGNHALHFAGAHYESLDRTVNVPAGQTVDAGAVKLRVTRGKIVVTSATPGAKVYLEHGSDRRELASLPIAVEMDALPDWQVHATKPGYCDFVQPIDFSDGSPERKIDVALHRPPCGSEK